MYHHDLDSDNSCTINGEFAEKFFVERFKERFGVEPVKAQEQQDKHHIDYFCKVKNHEMTCDVKYPKKIRREDNEVSNDFTWIELCSKGFPGWVFGKQDYIAFLLPNCREFLMVPRKKLEEYCRNSIITEVVLQQDQAYHKVYVRVNTKLEVDAVTLMSYKELEQIEKTWRM